MVDYRKSGWFNKIQLEKHSERCLSVAVVDFPHKPIDLLIDSASWSDAKHANRVWCGNPKLREVCRVSPKAKLHWEKKN